MYLFDKICSVAIGSIPIATALSLEINIPQIIVRSEQHNRGTQSSIIGNCKDKKVILIEDVAVTGNAIIKGVNTIRENGGICDICIVVVDRQEGAEKNCLDKGIRLFSLLKKSDFGISLDE
jgi:orotate phosphoribosyltransferase